jgi:hypothetical protein
MNELKKNLGVFALTILLMVIGAELYYRFANPAVLGNTGSLSYVKWSQNNVKLNSWGFRDKERDLKRASPDIKRILVIGPSNIYGQGVTNLEERLTERLEKKLNESSTTKYEVINFGTMTLDCIGSSVVLINNAVQAGMDFDAVVIYYAWNAIKHIPEIGQAYIQHKMSHYQEAKPNAIDQALSKGSYLYDWVKNVSKDKSFKIDGKTYTEWHMDFYKNDNYFQKHVEALQSINNMVSQHNAKLYLLITAISYSEKEREQYSAVKDKLLATLKSSGISYADASQIYNGIPELEIPVSKYDGHNKSKYYGDMVNILAPLISSDFIQDNVPQSAAH